MFGTKCQWEEVFDLPKEQGEAAIGQMVTHLQALPIDEGSLPDTIVEKLQNLSREDFLDDTVVGRTQWSYYQTAGGSVSAAAEYFEQGEMIPFHVRGYQLACNPKSDWGWWTALAVAIIGAFALGRID